MKRALIILLVPIVAHAYEYNTEGNSPEAAYAAYIGVVTVEQAITVSVIDKGDFIVFRITLRTTPYFPAEYVYAVKKVTITALPAMPEPSIHWYPGRPEGNATFNDEVKLIKQPGYTTYCVSVKADYHYGGKVTTNAPAPTCWTGQAPPPPPMFYFNESTFRSYEPSWGFSNCFHTFSWGIGEPDMICSPEAFGGF